ncbi:MAG: endonuclease/exonuclease/phosphatase family protein, partial [Ignavibacteriae bacterium]
MGDGINDRMVRSDADHLRIADIIIKTGADVLGVQEIENDRALKLVLRYLDGYDGFLTEGGSQQRVGVIFKKGVKVEKARGKVTLEPGSAYGHGSFLQGTQLSFMLSSSQSYGAMRVRLFCDGLQ